MNYSIGFSLLLSINLALLSEIAPAKEAIQSELELFVSGPIACLCLSINAGIRTSKNHIVGINYYSGGLPMAGGGSEFGIFSRSYPWENSFFVTTRIGWMQTIWGHPYMIESSGVSAGLDVGNQWSYQSGFTQGVTWVGFDFFLKKTDAGGLPHGLRYEIGYRF